MRIRARDNPGWPDSVPDIRASWWLRAMTASLHLRKLPNFIQFHSIRWLCPSQLAGTLFGIAIDSGWWRRLFRRLLFTVPRLHSIIPRAFFQNKITGHHLDRPCSRTTGSLGRRLNDPTGTKSRADCGCSPGRHSGRMWWKFRRSGRSSAMTCPRRRESTDPSEVIL